MATTLANNSPYSASFTAASLMREEMNAVLPYLLKDDSSQTVKMIEDSPEILPIKSVTARERVSIEMAKRFRTMPKSFWTDYQALSEDQQRLALFFVILKTYRLLFEFQVNVAVKKYHSANNTLQTGDLWMEFYNIASRDESASISPCSARLVCSTQTPLSSSASTSRRKPSFHMYASASSGSCRPASFRSTR